MAKGFVSQYTAVYCDKMGNEADGLCRDIGPQHSQPGHDTAQGRACDTATRPATRPTLGCNTVGGPATTRRHCSCARATWVRLCA